MDKSSKPEEICKIEVKTAQEYREAIPNIVE